MPFDLAKGTGTWKGTKRSDNYGEIMTKMGIPAEAQAMLKDAEIPLEITVSGNTFTSKGTMLGKTATNTFTIGEECEETDPTGNKRKVTYTMEGDTLVSVHPNHDGKGLVVRQTRRWLDDKTTRTEYKCGDLEGFTEMQKI
uniref:Liver-basic fatty acid binding protein n=1 Tax=Branchiostoma belcheri tsingtauense TaxID=155462 RepID=Q6J0U1_BRABE|nr:liver-basic fatty acid binding protein [Branchiostoma belcheri tsingtauense]